MQYQLPNGKVIQLSMEEYLSLTDRDLQYLLSINSGEYVTNLWKGSVLNKPEDMDPSEESEYEDINNKEDYFNDFFPDDDEYPDEPDMYIDYDE